MRVQMTPGVKVSQCHRFDSEVIQVRRMTAKWALDLNGTHLRTQGRAWKKAWKAVHRINTRGYLADVAAYTILDFLAHRIQYLFSTGRYTFKLILLNYGLRTIFQAIT